MKNNKVFLLLFVLMCSISIKVQSQWLTTGNTFIGNEFLGSNSGNFPLVLKTTPAQPINFYTNATQRMTILSGGNVGIGLASPSYKLDVTGGDINTQSAYGYRLGGNYVLRNNNITSNLYVGISAGNNTATTNCTFVGNMAGYKNTSHNTTLAGHLAEFLTYNTFAFIEPCSS